MITLKQQVANLLNEGLGTKEIYDRLKSTNPTTTYGSIAYTISILKNPPKVKPNAQETANKQTKENLTKKDVERIGVQVFKLLVDKVKES